jgi:hypothetical protein
MLIINSCCQFLQDSPYRTARSEITGMQQQECQYRTTSKGRPGQDSTRQDNSGRTAEPGQPGTVGKGQQGQDREMDGYIITARTVKQGKRRTNKNRIAGRGQRGQDRKDSRAGTGPPAQDERQDDQKTKKSSAGQLGRNNRE